MVMQRGGRVTVPVDESLEPQRCLACEAALRPHSSTSPHTARIHAMLVWTHVNTCQRGPLPTFWLYRNPYAEK